MKYHLDFNRHLMVYKKLLNPAPSVISFNDETGNSQHLTYLRCNYFYKQRLKIPPLAKSENQLKSHDVILTDEDIVDLYKESQEGRYFDMLYDRYGKKVFAKSISLLQERALAEDATQEIFVKILLNISKFKGTSKFSTWIYSITYNFCIDYIRKQKKRRVVADETEIEDEAVEEVSDKELLEIKIERLEVIMEKAESKDKAVLMMKYMDNMSIKDMAEVLNRSESAVKMSILRAKHRLKKIYKQIYNE